MARVEIATEAWGYIVSTNGRPMPGQLCAIDTTVYAAATGAGTIDPGAFISDEEGLLPGWVVPGRYTFTEPDSDTRTVIAGGGYQTVMDESSVMAKRDTLKFEGDAISLQDDSANDRTRVIVTGSPGAAGPPGEIFGVDVWNQEADPESVTDWGPIINALVADGERLLFRGETFPFSTALDFTGSHNLIVEGVAGITWDTVGGTPARLVWKGEASSGTAIDCRSADGLVFKDVVLEYDDSDYDDTFIDLGTLGGAEPPSAFVQFWRCRIGTNSSLKSAACLIKTDQSVAPQFHSCRISGATHLIRGWESGGTIAGNDLLAIGCMFSGCDIALCNIGINWNIERCTFQFNAMDSATGRDIACSSNFYMSKCTFWDNDGSGTQVPILQSSNNSWDATIRDCWIDVFNTATPIQFLGAGCVRFEDSTVNISTPVNVTNLFDLGTVDKDLVRIVGNKVSSTAGLGGIANLDGGHRIIEVHSNKVGSVRELRTFAGQIRLGYIGDSADYLPAQAASAGQANIASTGLTGTDLAGTVFVTTTGGGACNAGDLIDVTFAKELIASEGGPGTKIPVVIIAPTGTTAQARAAAAARGGSVVSTSKTGFKVCIDNPIPAGTTAQWAYWVVMM